MVSNILNCALLGLLSAVYAQEDLDIEERIFLTSSHPQAGVINYIEMYEHDSNPTHLWKVGDWKPLLTGLKYPTHTTYDFKNKLLYVCDCDSVVQYDVQFDNGTNSIKAVENGPIVQGAYCGGLTLDKWNNLFYVDTVGLSSVNKVPKDLLLTGKYPVDLIEKSVYDGAISSAAKSMQDIEIEQEYLYWASDADFTSHGGIHKAFTEPFIKQEPFQTYEIQDVIRANSVTTNENYLFFTGQTNGSKSKDLVDLFIQKKQGAGLYYHYSSDVVANGLKNPGALLTYKDTLLLISNEGFISMLDMTKFPPLPTDFQEYQITVDDMPDAGSNSICARLGQATSSAKSMSFITVNSETVNAKTLSSSGSSYLVASAMAMAGSLLLTLF